MEHKTLSLNECELKFECDQGKFKGYASVFNGVDTFGDTILPGAYKKTIKKNGSPKMFLMHQSWELPIGKYISLVEDAKGLLVEGEITPGMTRAADAYAAMKHDTLDGLSIGYMLSKGDWESSPDHEGGRIIKNVTKLVEISPVVFPADGKARIGSVKNEQMESEISELETVREFELFLRDAGGLSKGLAQSLVSRAKVVFAERDSQNKIIIKASALDATNRIIQKINAH